VERDKGRNGFRKALQKETWIDDGASGSLQTVEIGSDFPFFRTCNGARFPVAPNGIPSGKYRIAAVETLRREALDKLKKASKPKRGQISINEDTNFLEASFGETSSPFVLDLRTSSKLTLDMARPTD
jgi:hypothetical protein